MAILNSEKSLLAGLSGRCGDIVFRQHKGKTIMAKFPKKSTCKPTTGQAQQRDRFKQATEFAREIMNDSGQRASYEAQFGANNLYRSLIKEYFRITKSNC